MKIFLVTLSPKTHRTSEENLGILYLASVLRNEGYNVEVIDAWLENLSSNYVYNKLISEPSLFIGFSSYMTNTEPTIEMIKKLKQYNPKLKIVCGGFGPSFYPKEHLQDGADVVCIGEGEETIIELAHHFSGKLKIEKVKNIAYIKKGEYIESEKRVLLENLDVLPFPSRDNIYTVLTRKSTVNIVTSRGCSGNCEFCSVISFFRITKGKIWRQRSIENIVNEIEELYNKGVKYIKIVDDSFLDGSRDEKWCEEFSKEIQKRKIKVYLRGQIRADKVTDKSLYYLKKAGFFSFACGIENGSETALKRMNKKATKEENLKALKLFKKYNIMMQMGFILFDKYTTMKELKENYIFLLQNDHVITKGIFSEMYSAAGTKLNEKLKNGNFLKISNYKNNNNKYDICDSDVEKAYNALKKWHKSHSYIYDKCIDPLTAPKAIEKYYRKKFYKLALDLKKVDLKIFKYVLSSIEKGESIEIDSKIKEEANYYQKINTKLNELYKKSGLNYDALLNPFI